MRIDAVAVHATDLGRTTAFYGLLGFDFPPLEPGAVHVEAQAGIRLMVDDAGMHRQPDGSLPRPGTAAGFALLLDSPAEVDAVAGRVADAGHELVTPPFDAPWGQRYATVADPDGHRVDLFCPLGAAAG